MPQFTPDALNGWKDILQLRAGPVLQDAAVEIVGRQVVIYVSNEDDGGAAWRLVEDLEIPEPAVQVKGPLPILIPYPTDHEDQVEDVIRSLSAARFSLRPVSNPAARVLILGSMPGNESLRRFEYYSHPTNRFWRLIEDCLAIPRTLPYEARVSRLVTAGVALWDVLLYCERDGSLDRDIRLATEMPNDLAGFLSRHSAISMIGLNGCRASAAFGRYLADEVAAKHPPVLVTELPSTSPANTRYTYTELRNEWQGVLLGGS